MRERIKVPPAEEVVEYLFKSRSLGFLQRDYRLLMWINHVHTLMLMDQGIITQEAGKSLLRALAELEERGIEASSLDPNLEDLYLNFEHSLIQKVGVDVGGRIHTGRSRNDIYATIARIAAREALFTFSEDLFELREALLQLAGEHVDTVAPGYTHLQPAQPTTFGHYLVSVSLALERDGERLLEVYPRLNLCPLGACAFAGTGFAIDRHMTARLLAFDGIVESTLDAVASRDYVSELLAAIAVMGVTLSPGPLPLVLRRVGYRRGGRRRGLDQQHHAPEEEPHHPGAHQVQSRAPGWSPGVQPGSPEERQFHALPGYEHRSCRPSVGRPWSGRSHAETGQKDGAGP